MIQKEHVFNKKKALLLVVICAAVLLVLFFIRWHGEKSDSLTTTDGRVKFLASLGWEVDNASEEGKTVIIPEKLEGVMEEYNKMQVEQGMDLSAHCGEKCQQYTYVLKNYPSDKDNVFLSIYVLDGKLIAGDIHTNSVNGFMVGIMPSESAQK